jgi:hypothetical protein
MVCGGAAGPAAASSQVSAVVWSCPQLCLLPAACLSCSNPSVRDYRRHNKYTMRSVDRAPLDIEKVCMPARKGDTDMFDAAACSVAGRQLTDAPRPPPHCRAVHSLLRICLSACLLPACAVLCCAVLPSCCCHS